MTDDTDKLAAQMRNLKPSKKSRKAGLDAAMAAFDTEFSADTSMETTQAKADETADLKNNSNSTQGSADAPRPTVTSTKAVRVKTRRVETMTKFTSLFNFKPQTMMMAGTCSAAIIAGLIVLPNMNQFAIEPPVAAFEIGTEEAQSNTVVEEDVVVVTGSRAVIEKKLETASDALESIPAEDIGARPELSLAETVQTAPAPKPDGGISSVDNLLSDIRQNSSKTASGQKVQREADFRQNPNPQAAQGNRQRLVRPVAPSLSKGAPPPPNLQRGSLSAKSSSGWVNSRSVASEQEKAIGDYRAILQQRGNIQSFETKQGGVSSSVQIEKFGNLTLEETTPEFETITEMFVRQEASSKIVTKPAAYEIINETIVVIPQSVEYEVEPAEYEWVDGDVDGSAVEYDSIPAEYETIAADLVVQESSIELVSKPATFETIRETFIVRPPYLTANGSIVPAITKQVSRRVVKKPASIQERIIPAVTKKETHRVVKKPAAVTERVVPYQKKNGKTRVVVKPATVREKTVGPVTKEVSRRVVKRTAIAKHESIPAVLQTVERQVLVKPSKLYLRDDDGKIVREFEDRDAFEVYKANIPTVVEETPVSTFSVDVDTASYSFFRASINRGQLPPRQSIRLEEMINYFPYDYEAPKSADTPFKANVTVTPNPWNVDTKLMHIGIKGYVPTQTEKPRSNLVFLIDTSGSMRQANKLPLLVNSFKLLLDTLDEDDTVSIVAYASASGTVLEPTPVSNKSDILSALNNLRAGGSTAGAAGLELAYQKAQENFDDEGVNRVILATDGDFNVGFSSPEDMKTFIKKKRETGVFLSVLGFGQGNYNDHLMQSLAQNGNGVAAYIDNLAEANKVLANEAGSSLITIAKDVKIQVEFNPATVAEYRLIGYETRALKRQDFNNDKVDAGEIGAGHSVTAIYEMTPVGSPAITVDKLRYVSEEEKPKSSGSDEFAFVKIRHKLPDADKSTLQTFPVAKGQERRLNRASADMRFATAVAAVGQKLRGDPQLDDFSYDDAIALAKAAKGEDDDGYRAEFIQLVRLAKTLEP